MANLRLARHAEVPQIIALENQASGVFRDVEGYAWVDALDPMTADEVARSIDEEGLWAVEVDGRLVGYGLTYRHGDDCHLRELNVHSEHAGQGFGRRLVEHIAATARDRGCRRVVLTTFVAVPFNGPWYARLGFVVLDEGALEPWIAEEREAEKREGLDRMPRQAMALAL